jgi:prevent-host-death family protein
MTRIKIRALRAELANILATVRDRPVTITKHGNDVAVMVSPEVYSEYLRLRSVYTTIPTRRRPELVSCV